VDDAGDDGWLLPEVVGGLFIEEMTTTLLFFLFGAMTIFG
jgi:hypothetical protein